MPPATDSRDESTTPTAVASFHEAADVQGHEAMSPISPAVSAEAESPTHRSRFDIEHVHVEDDPRLWSRKRKLFTLVLISTSAMIATLGMNIYNPAINDIKAQLHATNQEISLSLSVFILVQGLTPLLWSAISEIRGRKFVYIFSISLYLIACGVLASAKSTAVLISMRILQAAGGSAVLTIGAATLADIYEPSERGTVVGIYYAAPLLGPSIGPILGGVLTEFFSWRATFYCLVIFAGTCLIFLLFFKDTFRKERSLSYVAALSRATRERNEKLRAKNEEERQREEKRLDGSLPHGVDIEALQQHRPELADVHLSFGDINPIRPLVSVLRRRNNIAVLIPSGFLFGFTYCITYTAVLTFAAAPYNYNALAIGLVLLSFGIGSMCGSILGGRWSDHVLAKRKAANGGRTSSEDRLQSTKAMMLLVPLAIIAYAWMADKKVNIGGVCVALFITGFSIIWVYSSTLAYIVDANAGRSSTAVATNSCFRGFGAFVAAEVAVPLQDALGDGGLYTLWAGVMVFSCLLILLTTAKGAYWRELAEEHERTRDEKS